MFQPIATFISENYTYEDYLKLKFELNSPEDVWEKAIDIFVDRIVSRYFLAIDKLMEKTDRYEMRKYGFAIVTLQCSLIDTLAKFRYAPDKNQNKKAFIDFLNENFTFGDKSENFAKKIYIDIRCGIVHSGATDGKSGLSCECIDLVSLLPNGSISLDLIILQKELKEYFDRYVQDLKNKEKDKLRQNFVLTMNVVCKVNN